MSLEQIRAVDYVVLLCEDLNGMRRFYEGVLGLESLSTGPTGSRCALAGPF